MNSLPQQATEAAITKVATGAQVIGGGSAITFGLTGGQWQAIGVIGGLAVALLGLIVKAVMDWHFKSQHLRIARLAAKADEDE